MRADDLSRSIMSSVSLSNLSSRMHAASPAQAGGFPLRPGRSRPFKPCNPPASPVRDPLAAIAIRLMRPRG